MSWNSYPPRGGPMVKVKGFPGPLYPPDSPKGPVPDSDFAVALKRTAARIGAWPWTPDQWDDSYSNRFAHGDGWGDATHAGIEGLQHWSGTIEASGNTGEATFNFLRSVKIGQGMPHAGEMAMDSVCVNLINSAWEDAQAPSTAMTVREAALKRAQSQIGQAESPPESNNTPYGSWYGENGVPWCAIFCSWCYEHGASDLTETCMTFTTVKESGAGDRYDYVPFIVADARNGRYGLSVTSSPKPGDMVCYDWNWNGEYDHVGLFENWTSGHEFEAVEGNTSTSNNSNGGQVMRRQRDVNGQGTVFVRVAEP